MSPPRLSKALLGWLAPREREDEVIGDLEEAHQARVRRHGRLVANVLTGFEALDMAAALLRERIGKRRGGREHYGLVRGSLGRSPSALAFSLLDFKLGFRMLVRYPGLTLLGGLGMAFAIFTGASAFEFMSQVVGPTLPLPDGDRVVGIRLWNAATSRGEGRASFDFVNWRDQLESVEELGAFRTLRRNLATGEGAGGPVVIAEISPSAFEVARVPPHLGRTLGTPDELPGAPPVVVVGYEIWQDLLGADPDAIGGSIRVGRESRTVVGVMPQGFAFPVAHGAWVPLLTSALADQPGEGPEIQVFGRLAPGATFEEAQAELTVLGSRTSREFAETHEHLRPQVMPYASSILNFNNSISAFLTSVLFMSSNVPLVLFLVLVCGNVALLMFARAVAREGELVVRCALGASRSRIVTQLFAEALALASVAAVVALAFVNFGVRWAFRMVEAELLGPGQLLPFWFTPGLSFGTVLYAGALTLVAAAVAGILPALKVTRGVGAQLRQASAGGGGFRFGGLWTVIVVGQIAATVTFPIFTFALRAEAEQKKAADIGFAAADYLGARMEMDRDIGSDLDAEASRKQFQSRYQTALRDLEERLEADFRVAGVTFTERLPRLYHPWSQIEVDGPSATPVDERGHRLGAASVEVDYFRTLGVDVVSGRDFDSRDLAADAGVVIVNESFVSRILGERNAIGARIRFLANEAFRSPDQEPGPWLEIIGVVEDLGTTSGYGPQGLYQPAAAADMYPAKIVVQVRADAQSFAPQLQSAALAIDPTLRLHDLMTLEDVTNAEQEFYKFWFALLLTVTSIALLLSWGGIYAIMSFTVSQRTREIGIRVALGSSRLRVVGAILRRPIAQVAVGVFSGCGLLAAVWVGFGDGAWFSLSALGGLAAYTTIMMAVCMLACTVPVRRALSVEPSEALRSEG